MVPHSAVSPSSFWVVQFLLLDPQEWTSEEICESALLSKSWLFLCLDSGTHCGSSSLLGLRSARPQPIVSCSLLVRVLGHVVVDCAGHPLSVSASHLISSQNGTETGHHFERSVELDGGSFFLGHCSGRQSVPPLFCFFFSFVDFPFSLFYFTSRPPLLGSHWWGCRT